MKNLNYLPLLLLVSLAFYGCEHESVYPTVIPYNKALEFLADTIPMTRVAVLEEISGVRCWYTPDGHTRSKFIFQVYQSKVLLVSIHASGFGSPSMGWPNYTSKQGNAIYAQSGSSSIPSASINRIKSSDLGVSPMNSYISVGRADWTGAVNKVIQLSTPVNVGTKATFDSLTRILTVRVDLYYTANDTFSNSINVFLLQDKIIGKQQSNNGILLDYEQNNVLRDMLTSGNFGEPITESTTKGSKISKIYKYTVPYFYNGYSADGGGAVIVKDLKVVAFVSHGQLEILNAAGASVY